MLTKTIYASIDDPTTLEALIRKEYQAFRIEKDTGGLRIFPNGSDAIPVICTIKIRNDAESADDFTDGMFRFYSTAPFSNPAFREKLLAQIFYTNAQIHFETEAYTPRNSAILNKIATLTEQVAGFRREGEHLVASAFMQDHALDFYSGVIYDISEMTSNARDTLPFFKISEREYQKRCGPEKKFHTVYEQQIQFEHRLIETPIEETLQHYFNEQKYAKIIATAEALPINERNWEITTTLGMAYYAESYAFPNAHAMRQKGVQTILSVKDDGEPHATWHDAMGYVLFFSDPATAAQHYQRASDLGGNVDRHMLASRLDQADRDRKYALRRSRKKPHDAAATPFAGFDFSSFWRDSEYVLENHVFPPPSDTLIKDTEAELGYKLPSSYVYLMKMHNGGAPEKTFHTTEEPTTWSEHGAELDSLYAIGNTGSYTLCGDLGSRFMIEEWGYPDIGVYIGHTPTAGHDMIALDYRFCGPEGEPEVVHVGQEDYFKITYIADDFESYIRGLTAPPEEE